MQVHNEAHMKAILTFTTPAIVASMFMIYWYLLQIDINKTLTLPTGLESVGSHEDFAKNKKSNEESETATSASAMSAGSAIMEEEDQPPAGETAGDGGVVAKTNNATTGVETDEEQPRRFRITRLRNIVLVLLSLGLSLVTYLILVVSSAPIWLRLLGVLAVIGMGLWQQIGEELRRQRLDRIVGIMTMILLAASLMSVATYANKSLQEGEIYQGKARIVGFNYQNYDNNDGDITRTDLEVAWGGEWGCPTEGGKQCQAFVQGAMCEAEKEEKEEKEEDHEEEDENDGGKMRRHLDNNDNEKDNNADGEENQNGEDQAQEEEEDLEEDLEEEEEENQELEEENQEEEQELEEYEEYTEELEEEVEAGAQYNYYWDDDMMYDAYWDEQDWGSVWGDYACYDLFDYDMSGSTYNADEAPGYDDWPFVNIYGNCKKCDAYIVDYFSTQHFQDIQDYRVQGRNYLILSVFGLVLTALLHFKHKTDPIAEKELELLPNDGGAMA